MRSFTLAFGVVCCWVVLSYGANAQQDTPAGQEPVHSIEPQGAWLETESNAADEPHARTKRTLFLKKKLLGAGLLGFGLGVAKGYKLGYHAPTEVRHVYVAAPPPPVTRYVEYIEKPIYVQRLKPEKEYGPPLQAEYGPPAW